jgi:hypothetical protein
MLVGSGYTDTLGMVTIDLDPVPSQPGIMDVTVTAYNKIPYFGTVSIVQGLEEELGNMGLSLKNKLYDLYPNPFSKSTTIGYQIANISQQVSISLYDASGRLVRKLINKELHEPGNYTKIWNGKDDLGHSVNNGVYFIKFLTDNNEEIEKLILLR